MSAFYRNLFLILFLIIDVQAYADSGSSRAYCDLPEQHTATGQLIKPYPIVALDLTDTKSDKGWLEYLNDCGGGTVYLIIRADSISEEVDCDVTATHCEFDLFHVMEEDLDPDFAGDAAEEGSKQLYSVNLLLSVHDHGAMDFKVQECPRGSLVVATGFYRFSYLGGNYETGAYEARRAIYDPVRAEVTLDAVNDSCFGFGDVYE